MTVNPLYQQLVLEHARAPRHFGRLAAPTHEADGLNPLCGDALHVDARVADGRIAELAFRGEACAIAIATASLLGDRALTLDAARFARLEADFARLIAGEIANDDELGELNALAALAHYPARRKCALLPFATLRAALDNMSTTTTEGKPK